MPYMAFYTLSLLSDELVFIKWHKIHKETTQPEAAFIDELRRLLEQAEHPLYFLSDLRLARIVDVNTLQRLGKLTQHPNYGGGVAFSEDIISTIFVNLFSKFAADPKKGESVMYKKVEEALTHLEKLKPGLTQGIDWNTVFAG
ncbi:MAG: hypothetical protein K8L97_18945 [Anaerolineae bacterium]|nr:hypothetical protein [Anaerolineae bacterium]